jgi:hypothetical protein
LEGKVTEKDRETLVLDWLNRNGVFAFKVNTVGIWDNDKKIYRQLGKFDLRGKPDIMGILPNGRFLGIEMKTPEGSLSTYQKAFLNKVNKHGGKGFVATSIEQVTEELNREELRVYI